MGTLTLVEDHGRVRFIILNREKHLNALCTELIKELLARLVDAEADDGVGCLIIRGAGHRAFCAGADLDEIQGADLEQAQAFIDRGHALMDAIAGSSIPVIAAVDGWALGGGMELALACHLLLSTTESKFGLPEAKIGCMPGFGGTQRIFGATTHAFAMRMLLTGESVTAQEAHSHGLLSFAPLPPDQFESRVLEVATTIAQGSRPGLERILRATRRATEPSALAYEAALAAAAISSADGQEGIRAFADKRSPKFHRSSDD